MTTITCDNNYLEMKKNTCHTCHDNNYLEMKNTRADFSDPRSKALEPL